MSLSSVFLAVFFGLLHSLSQKFSIFCSLSLLFLSTSFLQSTTARCVFGMRGVTRHWVLGALVQVFLPSLFRRFLTAYRCTLSSFERLESLWILPAVLCPGCQGTVVSVRPGMSFSPFLTMTKLGKLSLACTLQPRTDLHFLVNNRNVPYSGAGGHSHGSGHLLHGETTFVISSTGSNNVPLPFFPQSSSSSFCGHMLLIKGGNLHSSSTSVTSWQPVLGKEMFSCILKQPATSEEP